MWTSCMMEHFLLETLIVDQLQVVADVVQGVPYVDVVVVVQVVPYVDDGFVVAVDDDVVVVAVVV